MESLPSSRDDRDDGFVRLLARHEPEIRAFIRASLPSPEHVSEVMQNVSLVAWKKFGDLENPDDGFARWACVIARYEIMKFRRSLARDRFVLDDSIVETLCEEGTEEVDLRRSQIDRLEHCLEQLPTERRDLVMKAYAPGSSIKVLASTLGKEPNALYQLLRRIRLELEKCLLRSERGMEVGP